MFPVRRGCVIPKLSPCPRVPRKKHRDTALGSSLRPGSPARAWPVRTRASLGRPLLTGRQSCCILVQDLQTQREEVTSNPVSSEKTQGLPGTLVSSFPSDVGDPYQGLDYDSTSCLWSECSARSCVSHGWGKPGQRALTPDWNRAAGVSLRVQSSRSGHILPAFPGSASFGP